MISHKSVIIDIRAITNIEDVLFNLQRLDSELVKLNFEQFILFNKSYQTVTHLIHQAVNDGHFKNPEFIEKFIVNFANYYFEAINNTSNGDELSAPWVKLCDYSNIKSAPLFISLMLGANAHINYDLPQVLSKMMQTESPTDFLGDISKINRILMKSGYQIIELFEEKNKFLNFLKNRLIFAYYRPAMYTILYWRVRTWRNYEKLKKNSTAMQSITKRSIKIADRLLCVARTLS